MTDINYPSRALNSATDSVSIAGTIIASNPSVAPTGAAVPSDATYVAVDVGGNLTGLTGTANGLKVDGSAVTQPVSGSVTVTQATAANLNATVTGTVAATQSGTWNVDNVSGTVSLPTGASTSAKQPALGTAGTASADVITVQGIAGATAVIVDGSGSTQPVSGTVTANAGTGNFTVVQANPFALNANIQGTGTAGAPAGGILSVQGVVSGTAMNIQGTVAAYGQGTAGTPATGVVTVQGITNGTALAVNQAGRSSVNRVINNYAVTPVTTGAYVQVLGATTSTINRLYIFDSSGSAMILATGGIGSEVDQLYIGPGGSDAPYELAIGAGVRISLKALDTNATVGQFILTALS